MNKLKSILIICFLFLAISSFGEPTYKASSDSIQTYTYVYSELIGTQKVLSTKVNVSIDYGEETSLFKDTRLRDEETGKVPAFNSMVDALNYMGNNGWEFVQAYTITGQGGNVYHWLLKIKKEVKHKL